MLEILTNREMAQADRLTLSAGLSGAELMANAGRAVRLSVLGEAGRCKVKSWRLLAMAGSGNVLAGLDAGPGRKSVRPRADCRGLAGPSAENLG